ncbi:MAG: hypothetical protein C6W58_02120 [Bacillaceae bacterium]|uniref:hypothetical protein n=2 Tax=Aeribacillus TaxID=1055323 RepID=UPI000E3A12AF|nr:MAG: hypothetical protein C6W58_02120 [Bacillaceae bacterium]
MEMFEYNERLGIPLPAFSKHWDEYPNEVQQQILSDWECIRGQIPDRIKHLEAIINKKQEQLNDEEDFELSCRLNEEISEIASIINDLWLWYRIDPHITKA